MRVVLLRTNKVDPDPRVEKEVDALLECPDIDIKVVAWDRTEKYKIRIDKLDLPSGSAEIVRFGIPAVWGGGMRKNLIPFIKFNFYLFCWLIRNCRTYDCVHACDLSTALPSIIPILIFRKKFVYDICDYFADTKQSKGVIIKIIKWVENKIIGIADATIICSDKRKEQIQGSKPKKLEIIHNSPARNQMKFSNEEIDNKVCLSDSKLPKLVYVGNLIEDRFIRQLIDVVSELVNVELHIGGFGVLEEYVKMKAEKAENIYCYGKMQYSNVLRLESECDVMIALYDPNVPNHKYAAPNKFYEALIIGKPLIMFHNTGMDEIIDGNDVGTTIDATTESLRRGILELIDRKNEWTEMGKRLNYLYENEFSWDIMKKRLKQMYVEIQAD